MWEVLASRVFVLGGGDQSRTRIEQDLPKAGCWAVLSAWVIMGISRFASSLFGVGSDSQSRG
jgi:hypothetical protein